MTEDCEMKNKLSERFINHKFSKQCMYSTSIIVYFLQDCFLFTENNAFLRRLKPKKCR